MRTVLRKMGNSSGVIIPNPLLNELGVAAGDEMDMTIQDRRIIITLPQQHPRAGWREASRALAAAGDDGLVWPEFGNLDEESWQWRIAARSG